MSARPPIAASLRALDAVPAPIVVLARAGAVVHWNAACGAIAPRSLEDARGRSFGDLAAEPSESEPLARAIAEAGGRTVRAPARASVRWRGRDGSLRDLAWAISPMEGESDRLVAVAHDVTEIDAARDLALEALRALVRRAPVGILVSDTTGRYTDVNDAMCRMVGRTREQLVGTTILELISPEEVPRWHRARDTFLLSQTHFGEWNLRHADGSDVPVEIRATVTPDGFWQAFVDDLRERRAQERERERLLREAEDERRWLRTVLETVPAGVVLAERGGRLTFNRRAEEILGASAGGGARTGSRIFRLDGTPVPREALITTLVLSAEDTILAVELVVERPDGVRVPVLGSAAAIRDESGAVIGGVGVFQDVSERMRAQEAIRANERLLDGIFELLPVGLWIADRTGRIVRTNPAGLRLWGGARYVRPSDFDEYVGWWADTGERIAAEDWALARALRDGETSVGEIIRIRCFDGSEKTIINSAMPLRDERGEFAGAIVVNEDITALREIEDALRRAVLARDEVLRVVAHDLRGPLSAIVLQLHLLGREGVADERVRKAVALMQRQTGRMDRLIQDLLEIARVDAGSLAIERESIDVRALVEEVVEPRTLAAKDAAIVLESAIAEGVGDVLGDHDRLARVLENLVGNAMKFTGAGGRITVRVTPDRDEVMFAVADTGPGIPAEHLEHVFDRFWQRTKTDRRGAGLGLAIVKGIVEAHGGRVGVESRVGAGTTFWFTVPAAPHATASATASPHPPSAE